MWGDQCGVIGLNLIFVLTGRHPFVPTWFRSKDLRHLEARLYWTFPPSIISSNKIYLVKHRHLIEELMKVTGSKTSMQVLGVKTKDLCWGNVDNTFLKPIPKSYVFFRFLSHVIEFVLGWLSSRCDTDEPNSFKEEIRYGVSADRKALDLPSFLKKNEDKTEREGAIEGELRRWRGCQAGPCKIRLLVYYVISSLNFRIKFWTRYDKK
jgi:hypothetical protein